MDFIQLAQSISQTDQGWEVTIAENWMQGRTTYGGLSAALCLQAVQNEMPDLPPLRSAQINFIGPAGGTVVIKTEVMRQGKSVAYVSASMHGEKGLATHAVFCFGAARESVLHQNFGTKPSVPSVADCDAFFKRGPGPAFTNNFECRLAAGDVPTSGSDKSEFHIWCRHRDPAANDLVALVALADMPPPAVLPMLKAFAPLSSMTWMLNILEEQPTTQDGWWLLRSAGEHAKHGYSSQDMQVWNSAGELVITGRQSIAIFA